MDWNLSPLCVCVCVCVCVRGALTEGQGGDYELFVWWTLVRVKELSEQSQSLQT
jgi:hypothetical protein